MTLKNVLIWASGVALGALLFAWTSRTPPPASPPAGAPLAKSPQAEGTALQENRSLHEEVAQRPPPQEPAAPAPAGAGPSPLLQRLARLKTLLSSRDGTPAFEARVAEEVRDLRQAILSDPKAYLAFLKDEQDPALLKQCMEPLLLVDKQANGMGFVHTQHVDQFPPGLMDGLLGLLQAGTPAQQKAVLGFLGYPLGGQTPAFRDALLSALSPGGDPDVQAGALRALDSQWAQWPADPAVQARLPDIQRIADLAPPGSQAFRESVYLLGRMQTPQADDYLLQRLEFNPDPQALTLLAPLLAGRLPQRPELAVRLGNALLASAPQVEGAHVQEFALAAITLAPEKAAGVLERVGNRSPTPRVRQVMDAWAAKLKQGGTIGPTDRAALDEAWQDYLSSHLEP